MPKYVTIAYGDRAGYEKTPEDLRAAAHAQDKRLQDEGALIGIAGVPVQVRNTCGMEIRTDAGAYLSSRLPVAGFSIIEAEDISQVIKMVAQTPCAIAYGVVEVWPLETTNDTSCPSTLTFIPLGGAINSRLRSRYGIPSMASGEFPEIRPVHPAGKFSSPIVSNSLSGGHRDRN
jgi:hypothetical protein